MRWTFFSRILPDPNSSAAGVRMLELLSLAVERSGPGNVTFATSGRLINNSVRALNKMGVEVAHTPLNNDEALEKAVRDSKPDVAIFDTFIAEESFSHAVDRIAPDCLRVLDMQDLHSLRLYRQNLVLEDGMAIDDLVDKLPGVADPPLVRELGSIMRSDATLVCGRMERDVLESHYKINPRKLHVAPFLFGPIGSENVRLKPRGAYTKNFVSIGNFRHKPNHDMVQWLVKDIWPLIRAELPTAKLEVFGAYMDRESAALENIEQGVRMRGQMGRLHNLGNYRVLLAPLRFGSGIKGKIIDSWAFGVPVVTTPIGAESIAPYGNKSWGGLCTATTATAFAQDAIELYQNNKLWDSSRDAACYILDSRFNRDSGQSSFLKFIHSRLHTIKEDRATDYTMNVLMDSRSRANEYFSKYLEIKGQEKTV